MGADVAMVELERITPGIRLTGLDGVEAVEVLAVERYGNQAINVTFRSSRGPGSRILYRDDEVALCLVEAGRAFGFDGDGHAFRLAAEAQRIRLAHLFDPFLAVETSRIDALPHQISAVYGEMLPRQPLRFLLADDPGAGKTVMAGLLIKELLVRGDLERCLIIAPGSLVEQWQDELSEKFDLSFDILTRDQIEGSRTGNPFAERDRLVMRLDMAARSDELRAKLEAAPEWDLVICDEAHRMAATLFGNEVQYTRRYQLGQLVGTLTRHLLLMSATPHNGKEADFQLFMSLLDSDRFEGRVREGTRKVDASDMMRRLTKEELRRFDGAPLFPERCAYTVQYELSPLEAELYAAVTRYVREQMNSADRLTGDGRRRNSVGFALQILQRRLASSPAAIHQSLRRRRERLEARLAEERLVARGDGSLGSAAADRYVADEDLDEIGGAELEDAEQSVIDQATAAQTLAELEAEILALRDLEALAERLRRSGEDAKWRELSAILDRAPMVDEATGTHRKLLIFTEPKDTLDYLAERIRQRIGRADAVEVIHGGVPRDRRRAVIAAFNDDPTLRVLIANDAAGEGVNLQRGAHLMVNYDLPWNPNRLEQRFGRIHRIGQTEVCHLWNLVAGETREGEVYLRLLEKIEEARAALGGRVYDVLGELFDGRPLRDLLMEAVRYGERADVKEKLFTAVEGAVDVAAIERLVAERKLTTEGLDPARVTAIRETMERAQARRLQPRYVRAFFEAVFERLGGQMRRREPGRYEIVRVPAVLRERDRVAGRGDPVLARYERVCFDKANIAGQPRAALVAPGHPLLDALVAVTLERDGAVLRRGAILVDDTDRFEEPRVLVALEHGVSDGRPGRGGQPHLISRRLQFVSIGRTDDAIDAGPAPYLDARPLKEPEIERVQALLGDAWLKGDIERAAIGHAIAALVPDHLREVRERRLPEIDRVAREVTDRLTRAINWWDARAEELRLQEAAGKVTRLNASNAAATAERLADRLRRRMAELDAERAIAPLSPQVKGAALVVPAALLRAAEPAAVVGMFAENATDRAEVERLAMESVMAAERAAGRVAVDVSARKIGYDIESRDPVTGEPRFIEVKGRSGDADVIIVTRNEILTALNAGDRYWLALVRVGQGYAEPPRYVRQPFSKEPDFGSTAVVYSIGDLLGRTLGASAA